MPACGRSDIPSEEPHRFLHPYHPKSTRALHVVATQAWIRPGVANALGRLWAQDILKVSCDYGAPHLVVDKVLAGLKVRSIIPKQDFAALRCLSRDVSAACAVLAALATRSGDIYDYTAQANTKDLISDVLARIPYWQTDYSAQYEGFEKLMFRNLVTFLESKTILSTDPLIIAAAEKTKAINASSRRQNASAT